jgi:predicted ATPase
MSPAIDHLAGEARRLLGVLHRQARRPFVLEITGTPKAGKTTLIGMLNSFLRQCGWRVHLLEERAGICPLPMKGHFFFNTWTTGSMLGGLLDAVDRDVDLVILDRGLFDALVWLEIQASEGHVSSEEADIFERFVLMERWQRLSDTTCVIDVDADEAMRRENENRLMIRTGSIMNPKRLTAFNAALTAVRSKHGHRFNLLPLSNNQSAKEGAEQLAQSLLERVSNWTDKIIAVISRSDAQTYFTTTTIDWKDASWSQFEALVQYRRRSEVEHDDAWVQLLACGAPVYPDKPFLSVRRRQPTQPPNTTRDDSGRLWQGCHVEQPASGVLNVEELQNQLLKRIKADLHLGQLDVRPDPVGLIWDKDGPEPRHLGVVFKISVEEKLASFLDEKEFRTNGRGHLVHSSFVDAGELAAGTALPQGCKLEAWSGEFLAKKWLH